MNYKFTDGEISEIIRELKLREKVYLNQVLKGKMSEKVKAHRIACLEDLVGQEIMLDRQPLTDLVERHKEVNRELDLRAVMYKKWIRSGRLKREQAVKQYRLWRSIEQKVKAVIPKQTALF